MICFQLLSRCSEAIKSHERQESNEIETNNARLILAVKRVLMIKALRAEQLERFANTWNLLSPKSKIALGKLKSGQTHLTHSDKNAIKHLIMSLKKKGFDVDGFPAIE